MSAWSMSTGLRAVEVASAGELREFAPQWVELWDRCPAATPFQHPDWLLPWWETFGSRSERLASIALYRGGRLAGLAPLYEDAGGVIRLIGTGISDYLDILLDPGLAAAGPAAVFERLDGRRWVLDDVPSGSALLACAPAGTAVEVCAVCPVAEVRGTYADFRAGLPRGVRRNLSRYRGRFPARFESAAPDTAEEFLEALFRLHSARWAGRNLPGVLAGERIRAFHRRAASELLGRRVATLDGFRLNGALVAVQYGFVCRNRAFFYLNGFEPGLRRNCPGFLLIGEAIELAIQRGVTEIDFLRGNEPYKYSWGARDRLNYRLLSPGFD